VLPLAEVADGVLPLVVELAEVAGPVPSGVLPPVVELAEVADGALPLADFPFSSRPVAVAGLAEVADACGPSSVACASCSAGSYEPSSVPLETAREPTDCA
jgi:hypothetical protein